MATANLGEFLRRLTRGMAAETLADNSDRQLVERALAGRDEAAFQAIVHRHGPMVYRVCWRVLQHRQDAEDAFQATFLILAQKLHTVRKHASLASWLHGVAHRVALKAKAQSAARRCREHRASPPDVLASDDVTWAEFRTALDFELSQLPDKWRLPLILCYLEGRTQEESASQLGWSKKTLRRRLEEARDALGCRLTGRGIAWSAALSAVLMSDCIASASPAPRLVALTIEAAADIAVGKAVATAASAKVVALTEGVMKAMFVAKLKTAVMLTAAIVVVTIGLGGLTLAGSGWADSSTRDAQEKIRAEQEKTPVKPSTPRTLRLPDTPFGYAEIELPAHFKTPITRRFDNTPADNPTTDHGAALGRVLFYDTRLSANNTISCGSCHVQKNAFVDPNRFSKGFEGKLTDRHAMSLVNLRYNTRGRFFWDERAENLEAAVLLPIQSKIEMGQDLPRLMDILAKDKHYPELFKNAFGDGKVTQERTGKALAQFLRSMVSCQSKYDEGLAKVASVRDDFENFTVQENRGKALFISNCAICHLPGQDAHFSMIAPLNNGLDADHKNTDGGVGDITLNARAIGLFKSPSLRNVEHTAPYMHDGRFDTLEKVIDHYSKEVKPHPNLDPRMRRLNFTDSEKAALVAFLKTLTDQKFLTDPKFSDPFK